MHGGHHYMRATGNDREAEREQHRKSARLALDTSAHAGSEYHNFLRDSDEKVSASRKMPAMPPGRVSAMPPSL